MVDVAVVQLSGTQVSSSFLLCHLQSVVLFLRVQDEMQAIVFIFQAA